MSPFFGTRTDKKKIEDELRVERIESVGQDFDREVFGDQMIVLKNHDNVHLEFW